MSVQLVIQVSKDVVNALHDKQMATGDSQELFDTAKRLGLELHAMHPDVDDTDLQSYFSAEVSDALLVENIIDDLMKKRYIEAAYIKPPDELP